MRAHSANGLMKNEEKHRFHLPSPCGIDLKQESLTDGAEPSDRYDGRCRMKSGALLVTLLALLLDCVLPAGRRDWLAALLTQLGDTLTTLSFHA